MKQTINVTGLTCGHCVSAVSEEFQATSGVRSVQVDLVAGGTSVVTIDSTEELSTQQICEALDEAGDYHLA